MGRWQRSIDGALAACFVAGISAPIVATLLAGEDPERLAAEMRRAAPLPALEGSVESLEAWPRGFEAWWSDSFGLRRTLIRWHNLGKWHLFATSPTERMVLGEDDWLFTTADDSLAVHSGVAPFEELELEVWRQVLEGRDEWCRRHGMEYLLLLGPSKAWVYPERLPGRIQRLGPNRREQLAAYLEEHSSARFVDPGAELVRERERDEPGNHVYYPLGTHWANRGDFVAYRALAGAVAERFPEVRPLGWRQVRLRELAQPGDSWARRLYMEDRLVQRRHDLRPRGKPPYTRRNLPRSDVRSLEFTHEDGSLPRALLLHDSYGEHVRDLLAHDFSRLVTFWMFDFEERRILEERPDVVLGLYSDRALVFLRPEIALSQLQELLGSRFAESRRLVELPHDGYGRPRVELRGQVRAGAGGGALCVTPADLDHRLVLAEPELPAEARSITCVELECAEPFALGVHVGDDPWDWRRYRTIAQSKLPAGRSRLYFKRFGHGPGERAMLQADTGGAELVLHSVELRLVEE